ncbi:FUN14 family protein [Colletotrichum truncatum]|uniref:FUN14 family protein n=1 Tax=Colletotrichum truncatum TaxID=5467 RepID=A0ACC3YI71_COLTU|nr:FUN14 family protein [Colletotrichum truncatum]KAF6794547.1 FUN14 family protein [Colletotrichum truncatum]
MSRLLSAGLAGRRLALPVGTGVCVAYSLQCRRAPIFFDTYQAPTNSTVSRVRSRSHRGLSSEAMRQLSSGSLSGFGAGLLVGFLSHTLVLLTGLSMLTFYLAQRCGVDLPRLLGLKERLNKAGLSKPFRNAIFRLSFAATFTLAAFVRF